MGVRGPRAFVGVYRECRSRPLAQDPREKKHSRAVDKLEYLPVDVLRSAECRRGSMVFPQVNTVDGYVRAYSRRADQTAGESPSKKETEGDAMKRADALFTCLSSSQRKGKTRPPVARLISLILASGARSLKNKSELGMGCRNGDRNSRISSERWN